MRAAQIHVAEEYAYSKLGGAFGPKATHFLKATVLEASKSGKVKVRIEHPDPAVPDRDESLPTRNIVSRWRDTPGIEAPVQTDYADDENRALGAPRMTCEDQAAREWAEIVAQRARVDRLSALGITRRYARYAEEGGQQERFMLNGMEGSHQTTSFTKDEIERLLNLAEAGARVPELEQRAEAAEYGEGF